MELVSPGTVQEPQSIVAPETSLWKEIASDPAAILILYILRMKDEHDIAELSQAIPPELTALYDKVLLRLSSEGIIKITETKIRLAPSENHSFWIQDYQSLINALPTINLVATTKAITNVSKNAYGNICRGFFYPLEYQEDVLAVLKEARIKLVKIAERTANSKHAEIGYTSITCTQLAPKDIV